MTHAPRLRFSHIGLHVHDLPPMVEFYTQLPGLEVPDRGPLGIPGNPEIAFLSGDPSEHHQIALVEGRNDGSIERGVIQQISFSVETLDALRTVRRRAEALGVSPFLPISHGNASSIYFPDPEENGIECFVPSTWHVRQLVVDGFDLSLPDAEILEQTRAQYADTPGFQPAEDWRESLAKQLEQR